MVVLQEDTDILFKKAFDEISKLKLKLAPDVRLKFYAFYKQATYGDNFAFNSEANIISAFKFNAWMQLKGMSVQEAKLAYIDLANSIINNPKNEKSLPSM